MINLRTPIRATGELLQNCGSLLMQLGSKALEYARHPSRLREHMNVWTALRQDRAQQTRLNRQVRSQFSEAFNRSAKKEMTVDLHEKLRRYKRRNGFYSALLRPYEGFSSLSFPLKIAAAAAFSKSLRLLLIPVVGVWAIAVPLVAFVASRMGLIYRDAENRRQEEEFAKSGLVTPFTFKVEAKKTSVQGQQIDDAFMVGFPVMHRETALWMTSTYSDARKKLENRSLTHAAEFEACRSGSVSVSEAAGFRDIFAHDQGAKNCAFLLSVLFPEKQASEIIGAVQHMQSETAQIPAQGQKTGLSAKFKSSAGDANAENLLTQAGFPAAIVSALDAFCLRGREDRGLSIFSGKISMDDIRFLVGLQALHLRPDAQQAKEISRMLRDPRFADEMPLKKIIEVALWPKEHVAIFDELWKDREYRARFGFDALKDMTFNIEGWGGVAVNLARHAYTQSLSGKDVIELALPQNEYWAKTYHQLRLSLPETTQNVSHADFKAAVHQFGLAAGGHICALATPDSLVQSVSILRPAAV
ncbi:MAG: hypothetical protein PW788_14265 [Micavibrio sp.]|nr:hypothetical protein [Micavibrio sp.]